MKQPAFCEKHNRNNLGEKFGICPECVKEEYKTEWKGEGLPPVSTVCQWDNGENDWCNVKVMGISDGELWVKPLDGSQSFVVCDGDFRPLPDERDLAIKETIGVISPTGEDPCNLAGKLYDAGYRKYSAKPGFEWRYVCSTCGCKVEPGEELPHGC